MAKIISKFPELAKRNGWTIGQVMDKGNMSDYTAARLLRGDPNFTIKTLEQLCVGFQVKPQDIIELVEA